MLQLARAVFSKIEKVFSADIQNAPQANEEKPRRCRNVSNLAIQEESIHSPGSPEMKENAQNPTVGSAASKWCARASPHSL